MYTGTIRKEPLRQRPRKGKHLCSLRGDLRVLIYEMEHDSSLDAPSWQIELLRKSLRSIEEEIEEFGKNWS